MIRYLVGLFFFFGSIVSIHAQGLDFNYSHEAFSISVKEKLSVGANPLMMATGDAFAVAWSGFGPDLRNKVINQTKLLVKGGYGIHSGLADYFAAVAFAITDEHLGNAEMVEFLNMTQKVIENHPGKPAQKYFARMKNFFEYRALYHTDYLHVGFNNDSYRFVYIEPEDVVEEDSYPEEDTTSVEEEWTDDEWNEEDWNEEDWNEEDWNEEETFDDSATSDEVIEPEEVITRTPVGPTIRFDRGNIIVDVNYDSIAIKNISGSLLVIDDIFIGEQATIDWTTLGFDKKEVYAKVKGFELNVTRPEFVFRGATLKYKDVFDLPIAGEVAYKPEKTSSAQNKNYPRFTSLANNLTANNLAGPNSSYHGGFTLAGKRISSISKDRGPSVFTVDDSGKRKLKVSASLIEFADSVLTTSQARLVIYTKFDSIYHPSVRIRYDVASNTLIAQKTTGNFRNTPYVASANNMSFTADLVSWHLNQDSVYFSTLLARDQVPLIFQSNEYYDRNIFSSLSGLYDFNPLKLVLAYAEKEGVDEFNLADLADEKNINLKILQGAVMGLYERGYVVYDRMSDRVVITEKGWHKGQAQRGKADFDSILLLSQVSVGSNAIYNLKTQEIHIYGVDKFYLAKVLDVAVEPDSSKITILKNRDIKFNGRLAAGNFDYVGRDFIFRYDSFLVEMQQIDAIELYVLEETKQGTKRVKLNNSLSGIPEGGLKKPAPQRPEYPVDSTAFDQSAAPDTSLIRKPAVAAISGTSGVLYINKPNNKSGKKLIPNFPKFKGGGTGSVVYFDKPEILGGVYDRSLYFTLPPFDLDSLNDSDMGAIKFTGTFHSDDWFPDFTEKLHIMPDYSLGFDHAIPPDGYQLFGGNGRLFNRITLDRNGLVGHGTLKFLTSSMVSENFVFYPDSVAADGVAFDMLKEEFGGVYYPRIVAENYHMKWLPQKDSMYITSKGVPFTMYEGNASLSGSVIVTNKGVNGLGVLNSHNSVTISNNYSFNADDYGARHAQFEIKSDNPEKPALLGDDVRLSFNMDTRQVSISPEVEGMAAISFPYAQFKTSITNARWDLDSQMVYMSKPEDVDINSSYFYTTREDLDSLRFTATNAVYDMQNLELKVSGIPYITVADARITPQNGEVLILENSRIGTLHNTTIKLDTLTGYHELYDATVTIISRNEFIGEGTYRFINALEDTFAIKLHDFHLEEFAEGRRGQNITRHTVATGNISEEDNFLISPGMYYKGDVKLLAHKPALQLDGYVKLDLKSIEDYDTWIKYASSAEQQEIEFKFEESVTASGKLLSAGLHFDYRDQSLYTTFIFDKRDDQDEDFFKPSGFLSFKTDSSEYIIINRNKDLGISYSGKVFAYNPTTKGIRFEGPVHFIDNSKTMEIKAAAIGQGNFETNALEFNSFMTMDFKIPSTIYAMMADDFAGIIDEFGAPEAVTDRTELLYLLAEIIGDRATKAYEERSNLNYVPLASMSPNLVKPFVFSNLKFKWSDDQTAFYNDGHVGLSNILRTDLNADFEGFFEIRKTEAGETINLFIKAAPESWYYFSYEDNKLFIFSSNKELNTFVKEKTNIGKAKIGEFQFGPSDLGETLSFINTFRAIYFDIDEEYDLQGEVVMEEQQKDTEVDEDDDGF